MAGRGRGPRSLLRLPRAGRRVSRDRAVSVPPEGGATAPRPRGREPCLPRLRADLAGAPLARPSRSRQRRPPAAARAREPRREPGGPALVDRLPRKRVSSARDDPDPEHAGRGRRAGRRAEGRGEEDRGNAAQEGRYPKAGLDAAAGSATAGRAGAPPLPVHEALAHSAQHHQVAHTARESEQDCELRIKLSHLSWVLPSAGQWKP